MDHDNLVIIARVAGALTIGAMIGFELTFHGRPAGLRTHALICIASAILMIVTVYQKGKLLNFGLRRPVTKAGCLPKLSVRLCNRLNAGAA
jgi:uncharacterized membrane protein YhiD involved in acid resistance